MASIGVTTVELKANAQPMIESMTAIGAAWLEAGERMVDAADAMLRGAQLLREQQAGQADDMWGETAEPFVCDTHENCQFSETA